MSYISVPRQAGGHLKNGVLDILETWSSGHIGGGIAYERIVALAARSTAPTTEATVVNVLDEYITAKDAEIARCHARLEIDHVWRGTGLTRHELPMGERAAFPDGIECRDDTIKAMKALADKRDAEIKRLRAGWMKCLQDENECEAWLHESPCRLYEACACALELELWCNRAVPTEDI